LESFGGTFPLIDEWMVWQVGNGKSVRIGEDPWVCSGDGFKLSDDLVGDLHDQVIYSLWDARLGEMDHIGRSS
jgi:hypothetical protein